MDASSFFDSESFITVEAISAKRIFLALQRMNYSSCDLPPIEPALRKFLTKEMNLSPEEFNAFRIGQLYRQKLLEQVTITWHSVSHNSHGVLWMERIQLTQQLVSKLKINDLNISIVACPSDHLILQNFVAVADINTFVKLKVIVNYTGDVESEPLFLNLVVPIMSDQSFSWIGKINDISLKPLLPNTSVEHTFSVCFHEKGKFNIMAFCNGSTQKFKSHWVNDLDLVVK